MCVDENKMYYCCETTTTAAPAATTEASRGTCPPQSSPCPEKPPKRTTQQRECTFDYQCPDNYGCCYDNCRQEYKCFRLLPNAAFPTMAPLVSTQRRYPHRYYHHHHEDETRVERSTHDEESEKAPSSGTPGNGTKVPVAAVVSSERRHGAGEAEVIVMVDEGRQGSTQPLYHLLEPLTRLPHPNLGMLFLPLHPQDGRTAAWEAVQCTTRAAPEHRTALNLVACVLAAAPPLRSHPNSLLPSVRECGPELKVNWTTLQTCVSRGRGGSLLRGALLRHGRLLEAARKHQLAGKQPAGAVLAVNGTLVEGVAAAAAAAVATTLPGHHDSAPSSGGPAS